MTLKIIPGDRIDSVSQRASLHDQLKDQSNERQRSKKDRIERIEDKVNEMRHDIDYVKSDMNYIKNILHQLLEKQIQREQESTQQSLGHDPQSIII